MENKKNQGSLPQECKFLGPEKHSVSLGCELSFNENEYKQKEKNCLQK